MFNMICAILIEKKVITEKEGELLAKELGTAMLPSDFKASQRTLRKILHKIVEKS